MSFKISKIFAIPLIFLSFLFDTNNEFNKVNANIENSPANKNDLDLYHGMGVAFLCNATRKGFDLDSYHNYLAHKPKNKKFHSTSNLKLHSKSAL